METPKPAHTASEATFLGKSIEIKGEVSCDDDLYIDGKVEGTIDPKGYRLTIGPNGRVVANITARAVVVQGRLEGNIQASDRVDLKQSATVVGNIVTQRISIDEGVSFRGRANIRRESPKDKLAETTGLSTESK